jgi:hypothetical protein
MNYTERIDELNGILEVAQSQESPAWMTIILKRIKQLKALRDEEYPLLFPPGMLVARQMGPLYTGQVIEPTTADRERCRRELGIWRDVPAVLVQWRNNRSWEYAKDLRTVP